MPSAVQNASITNPRVSTEAGIWAAEVASRLRLLQASLADGETEARIHLLEEELDRSLKQVALGKRSDYFDALDSEFPTFEARVSQEAPAGDAASPPAMPADPYSLARMLAESVPASGPERDAVMDYLEQAGFVRYKAVNGGEVPEEAEAFFKKLLGDKPLDAGRAYRLMNVMVEYVTNIDQIVWMTWKRVAPKSLVQQEGGRANDFRKAIAPYLSGDPEISTEEIKQQVARTRKLISGMLSSIGGACATYAASLLDRLSPEMVKQKAQEEPGSMFETVEKKCWRRYNDMHKEFSHSVVEKELLEAVRKYTEKMVLGAAVKDLEE
jgi:hypothetical protein